MDMDNSAVMAGVVKGHGDGRGDKWYWKQYNKITINN